MPNLPDKILINKGGSGGMNALIDSDFANLEMLGAEIQSLGLTNQTTDMRDKMKALCATHYKAQMKYHEGLKALTEEMAEMIDNHLLNPSKP